jgi:predicted PurR-regulated permease PerM
METAQLYQGLTFLAYSTGAIVILIGIMLVKVLFDVSNLAKNVNETVVIIKTELEPTLKNLNKSVEILSGIVIKTDASIQKVKDFISKTPLKLIGQLSSVTGKVTKGFWSGLCTAFKLFSKK